MIKRFMSIFNVFLEAFKKVCKVSDKDSRTQEIVLYVVLVSFTLLFLLASLYGMYIVTWLFQR